MRKTDFSHRCINRSISGGWTRLPHHELSAVVPRISQLVGYDAISKSAACLSVSSCAVDTQVASGLNNLVEMTFEISMKLFAVVTVSPIFVFPGALLLMIMGWLGRAYMKAQLAVKRERSNALSPVLGHFGAAMSGLGASFDFSQGFWRS